MSSRLKQAGSTKISLVVSDLSSRGANRWGGGVRPFLLAQAWQNLGYRVEMCGVAFESEPLSLPTENSEFPIFRIPCGYTSGFFAAVRQLLPLISGDIICAVKLKPTSFGIALLKKLLTNRPLLLDIDDWELSWYGGQGYSYRPSVGQLTRDIVKPDGLLRHPDHPLYLQGIEKLSSQADIITVHNQFLQQRFGGIYLPNGKDTQLFNPDNYDPVASKAKYGLTDYQVIMFPGAPRPYKGLEDVLQALAILNQPDWRLVIVGGSPYDEYDQELLATWGKWIIKLPKFPYATMPEIVAAADLIVVPQRDTPAAQAQFPLKLTDGMAMAKPVLATTVGDIPIILGNTGYLVPPNSPEAIAQQLIWIFAHPEEAREKGRQARYRCLQEYSIDKMSEILAQVIANINIRKKYR